MQSHDDEIKPNPLLDFIFPRQNWTKEKMIQEMIKMFTPSVDKEVVCMVAENCNWDPEKTQAALSSMVADAVPAAAGPENIDDILCLVKGEMKEQIEEMRRFENLQAEKHCNASVEVPTNSLCSLKAEYRPRNTPASASSSEDEGVVITEIQQQRCSRRKYLDHAVEALDVKLEAAEAGDKQPTQPEPARVSPTGAIPKRKETIIEPAAAQPSASVLVALPVEIEPVSSIKTKMDIAQETLPSLMSSLNVNQPACSRDPWHNEDWAPLSKLEEYIKDGVRVLVLMRGCPGSGKSHLARSIIERNFPGHKVEDFVFSSDDYFIHINNGVYVFNASKLQNAHFYNKARVKSALTEGRSPVIVDNTNTMMWEMMDYAMMGINNGYILYPMTPNTPWRSDPRELVRRNRHNVPYDSIVRMLNRFEQNISGPILYAASGRRYAYDKRPPMKRKIPAITADSTQHEIRGTSSPTVYLSSERYTTVSVKEKSPKPLRRLPECTTTKEVNKIINITQGDSAKKQVESGPIVSYTQNNIEKESKVQSIETIAKNNIDKESESKPKKNEAVLLEQVVPNTDSDRSDSPVRDFERTQWEDQFYSNDSQSSTSSDSCALEDTSDESNSNGDNFGIDTTDKKSDGYNSEELDAWFNDGPKPEPPPNPHRKPDTLPKKYLNLKECNRYEANRKELMIPATKSHIGKEREMARQHLSSSFNAVPAQRRYVNGKVVRIEKRMNNNLQAESNDANMFRNTGHLDEDLKNEVRPELLCDGIPEPVDRQEEILKEKMMLNELKQRHQTMQLAQNRQDELFDSDECSAENVEENTNIHDEEDTETMYMSIRSTVEDTKDPLSSSNSDNDSEDSRSSELDITQYDICPEVKQIEEEQQSANGKLSGIFSYLKKSFLGNNNDDTKNEKNDDENSDEENCAGAVERKETADAFDLLDDFTPSLQEPDQDDSPALRSEGVDKERMVSTVSVVPDPDEPKKFEKDLEIMIEAQTTDVYRAYDATPNELDLELDIPSTPRGTPSPEPTPWDSLNTTIWAKPAFPLDSNHYDLLKRLSVIVERKQTRDQSTSTEPRDFDIAFVGYTDDEGYKFLHPVSRDINESGKSAQDRQLSPPTGKLMLDKSTMTGNTSVLVEAEIFDLEKHCDYEDRSNELVQRFSYLPRACVQDVYENLCQRDFNWTVDYLKGLQQDQIDLYANDQQESVPVDNTSRRPSSDSSSGDSRPGSPSLSQSQAQSSPADSRQPKRRSRAKRNKDRLSGEQLALKQHLEEQFVLNQESYPEHTLKVKKWKSKGENKDMELNVLKEVANEENMCTDNIPNTEPQLKPELVSQSYDSESDDSTSDVSEEETIELNLGYDVVETLEREFGAAGSDGLFPVVQVPRSLAQQLHKLWADSVQQQLQALQAQVDSMIRQDAQYAIQLAVEEKENAKANKPVTVSNVKQIIEMEVALETCKIDDKFSIRESQNERQLRITRMTLHEMFPHFDEEALYNILEASNRDLDETIKIVMENAREQPFTTIADVLKKEKNLCNALENDSGVTELEHHHMVGNEKSNSSEDENNADNLMPYEELMQIADDCRRKAQEQVKLRYENLSKAHMAARARMHDLARIYVDKADVHKNERALLNERAATALLSAQIHKNKDDTKIDLHHLHVAEALTSLDMFVEGHLASMKCGTRKTLYIVTGRGRHSPGQRSKIKPAVAKRLNAMNIQFDEGNPGMLNVYLRKK